MPRSPDVRKLHFHNPRLMRVGVEVLSLAELRARASAMLAIPQRLDFHQLLLMHAGTASHMVDFRSVTLEPGAVLLVRAGQVQQWRMHAGLQGQLVLISPDALAIASASAERDLRLLALDEWPAVMQPASAVLREVGGDIARMRTDIDRFTGNDVDAAIIRHTLLALLLRLTRERPAGEGTDANNRQAQIYRLFARELEAAFRRRMSVLDYARRIGYSQSSLSRACVAMLGHTAKEAIDLRLVLEAKRLLVHSQATVLEIGHQLGFTEPTNFVKFFRRLEGRTPQAFRVESMAAAPALADS